MARGQVHDMDRVLDARADGRVIAIAEYGHLFRQADRALAQVRHQVVRNVSGGPPLSSRSSGLRPDLTSGGLRPRACRHRRQQPSVLHRDRPQLIRLPEHPCMLRTATSTATLYFPADRRRARSCPVAENANRRTHPAFRDDSKSILPGGAASDGNHARSGSRTEANRRACATDRD